MEKTRNKYTKRNDFPEKLETGLSTYCFVCHKKQPKRQTRCDFCGVDSKRALVWDNSIRQYFNNDDFLVHESTGAFVVNNFGKVLLIELDKFPFGYTIPAGHVDVTETSQEACVREFKEEVGLSIENLEVLYQGEIRGDSCSRGADIHDWTFYIATPVDEGVLLNEESKSFLWTDMSSLPDNLTLPVSVCLEQVGVMDRISEYIKNIPRAS